MAGRRRRPTHRLRHICGCDRHHTPSSWCRARARSGGSIHAFFQPILGNATLRALRKFEINPLGKYATVFCLARLGDVIGALCAASDYRGIRVIAHSVVGTREVGEGRTSGRVACRTGTLGFFARERRRGRRLADPLRRDRLRHQPVDRATAKASARGGRRPPLGQAVPVSQNKSGNRAGRAPSG